VLKGDGRRVTFALAGEVDPLLKLLATQHVTEIEAHAPTLEDFFFALYREAEPSASSQHAQAGT
jgi:hypothetical protein